MDERSSKRSKQEHDFAITAFRVFREAVDPDSEMHPESVSSDEEPTAAERHAAAVILGRKGGKKGGIARAAKLTPEERSAIAKRAAQARWSDKA